MLNRFWQRGKTAFPQIGRRGFTLVEALVAMSLLSLVILCFVPLILKCQEMIYGAGAGEKLIREQRAEIEAGSGRAARGEGDTQDITTVFLIPQSGETLRIVRESFVVTDTEDTADFNLITLIAKPVSPDYSSLTVTPSELAGMESYSGQEVVISMPGLPLPDGSFISYFELRDREGNIIASVTYSGGADGTVVMTLSQDISHEGSPYTLYYYPEPVGRDTVYTAEIRISE